VLHRARPRRPAARMSILKKSLGGDRRLGDVGGNARPTFGISDRSCHEKGLRRALPRRRSPSPHRPRKPESRWRISQYLILRCAPKAFLNRPPKLMPKGTGQAAHQGRGTAARGEYRQAAGANGPNKNRAPSTSLGAFYSACLRDYRLVCSSTNTIE